MGCWSGTVGMLELNYFREHFLFAKGEILHVRHIFFGKINKFLRKNVHEKQTSQPNPSPRVWQNYIYCIFCIYRAGPSRTAALTYMCTVLIIIFFIFYWISMIHLVVWCNIDYIMQMKEDRLYKNNISILPFPNWTVYCTIGCSDFFTFKIRPVQ